MDNINANQMPPVTPEGQEKKSVGPLIAVIIILALIIIGGLYFLNERSSQERSIPQIEESSDIVDSLNTQSESDSLDSIEADLNAETFDNLDQGAAAIQAELDAELE